MLKIEVEDDSGNEISEITVPIPFNIRIKMDEGMSRYRVKLIDDLGGIRGQYMGSTDQKILELHVPTIKLPRLGKIRILVEESAGDSNYSQQYSVSIHYLEYIPQTLSEDISESFRESSEEATEFIRTSIKEKDEKEYLFQRQQFLEEDLISQDLPDQIDSKSQGDTIKTKIHDIEEEE